MRTGTTQGEDGAPGVTRRVVRLLVLLGAVVAAYLVLSLLDHAARADAGLVDQLIKQAKDPAASVEATATGARNAISKPKSINSKSTAPKAHPQRIHRAKAQAPKKVHAPKIQAQRKIQAPSVRAGETVRRVQARTSKLRQPASDVVRDAAQATVATERTADVRQKLSASAKLPSLPKLTDLPDLPLVELPALPPLPSWTQLPSLPHLPGLPQAQLAAWPQLSSLSQLPSLPHLPGLPHARTSVLNRTTAFSSAPVPLPPVSAYVCPLPQPPAFAPTPGLSGVTNPPAAQAPPRTAPLPAPPRQPADRSIPTGQARDSGGGKAPAMGTVSSSWRPETAAAGRRSTTDLIARGRTVRYAGPPS